MTVGGQEFDDVGFSQPCGPQPGEHHGEADTESACSGSADDAKHIERHITATLEQPLGKLDDFLLRLGSHHAAARYDDGPLCSGQRCGCLANPVHFRARPEGGVLFVPLFDDQLEVSFLLDHLTMISARLQMHRSWRSAGRLSKGLSEKVRQAA